MTTMWYVFHGPNTLARDEEIARMKAKLGAPEVAPLNITTVERGAPLRDLIAACEAMPFLTDKRLVIAMGWLSGLGMGKARPKRETAQPAASPLDELIAYLPTMPDTTRLVFAEDSTLPETHPLLRPDRAGSAGIVRLFALPADPVAWIIERAKAKGGEISREAAVLLSTRIHRGNTGDRDHFDVDARTYLLKLDNELEKLVSFALNRRIEPKDVEALVPAEDVADIFKFIDAVSARDAAAAYHAVGGVLARGESPLVVLSHLARQVRLLIQAKEHPRLPSEDLARIISAHPFVAKKVAQQAAHFTPEALERALVALLEADAAIKSGRLDETTALDVLIAALCA